MLIAILVRSGVKWSTLSTFWSKNDNYSTATTIETLRRVYAGMASKLKCKTLHYDVMAEALK